MRYSPGVENLLVASILLLVLTADLHYDGSRSALASFCSLCLGFRILEVPAKSVVCDPNLHYYTFRYITTRAVAVVPHPYLYLCIRRSWGECAEDEIRVNEDVVVDSGSTNQR
jgi:hypothetical protein